MDILIKDIDINNVNIRDIQVFQPPGWTTNPTSVFTAPPITQQVGVPIVNMPGCVEAHEQNFSKEKSGILSEDDPKGVRTFCDAGVPSFNPLDYNKDELKFEYEAPIPKVAPPEQPEVKAPETPDTGRAVTINCPTEAQELKEPVGTLVDGGKKKITEYRLVGKECIPVKEEIKIPDQIIQAIPTAGAITTTAGIAVVATTSALLAKPLADLLLKVVKPTVKKVIKKIAAIRGKQTPIESVKDRRDQQRIRSHAIRKLKGKE
ncbi:gp164 [Synechococcus phage syn9]|uniref:Gp164 n=1 Tax=Synechococcus phage syn9 TaxID=382359 RepID=Q0QZ61_BPSYS|nr:gp164 [Synechococcus phage syn9]ABA47135.1 gp164 [Synechococcus phage syn9]AGH56513.1 hypothetical protein CPUG_00020 [Cyanophage Syn10]